MKTRRLLSLFAVLPALAIATPPLDHTGQPQVGKASYYAKFFAGRKMANGEPMRPESNNAASRTLPLGTIALVTNLENGRSAVVEIKDRGPYVEGRIVDVSPGTADALGILHQGIAVVALVPLTVPQPDGSVKVMRPQELGG